MFPWNTCHEKYTWQPATRVMKNTLQIPHYHLEEATLIFRSHYPELVRSSSESVIPAFIRLFHLYDEQVMIKADTEIHVYKENKLE